MTDEPAGRPENADSGFVTGYVSSSVDSAESPNFPGNQVWEGPGARAEAYKTHWKNKPGVFPYGTNDEGGK